MNNNLDLLETILVAIPVYNEQVFFLDIVSSVHEFTKNILIVNDGSTDETEKLINMIDYIRVIEHVRNEGYGKSLIEAFRYANEYNFKWIITMDCDHQHQPLWLPNFFSEIYNDDADIISGSRYLDVKNMGSIEPPRERVAINKQITKLLNQILKIQITDAFCGFKAYRVKPLNKLNLTETGYGLPLQLWIQAAKANLKIREIPVPLIYHDPKRKFTGIFEQPKVRLDYYLSVIRQELILNGYTDFAKVSCT